MSLPGNRHALFWNRVLSIAEGLESASATDLAASLLALEEGFGHLADPVESFEAFTVLRLCRSLRQRLEALERGSP